MGESQTKCDKGKCQLDIFLLVHYARFGLTSAGNAPVLVPWRRRVRGGAGGTLGGPGGPGGRTLGEERLYKLTQLWNL